MENPNVRCSEGSLSATRALKGSMATLMEASMIIRIPAPISSGDIRPASEGELGIRNSMREARMAPARKYGRRRPSLHHVRSL